MRKATRILTLLVVLLGIVGIVGTFAAGKQEGKASTPGQKETLTVVTHSGWAATLKPANNDLPVYKEYERLTNIHIEWESIIAANYNEVMRARMAAATKLPDVINMAFATDIGQYGRDGLIIAQEDLIEKYAPRIKKWYSEPENQIYKILDASPDGHLYGVNGYVLAQFLSFQYLWNKPWLDKVGLKMPETQAEMVTALKAFRDKDPNGNGKKDEIPLTPAAGAGYLNLLSNMYGFNFSIASEFQVDPAGKVYWAYNQPKMKEYVAFLNMLYTEGLLDKAYQTDSWTQTTEKVANDTVGLISCWATFAGQYSGVSKYGKPDYSIPVFVNGPPVEGPYGDKYYVRREIRGGDAMGITKDCKKPDVAMRWIDFIRNSDEALALQNYGIEGVTYTKDAAGKILPINKPDKAFADALMEVGGSQPPFTHLQWAPGWDLRFAKWSTDNDKSYAKYYKPPTFPALQATKEEQDTLNKLMTDINTYRAEMIGKFVTGAEPVSKFDEFTAKLKQLGIDDVLKVRQQQYDRYLKLSGKK